MLNWAKKEDWVIWWDGPGTISHDSSRQKENIEKMFLFRFMTKLTSSLPTSTFTPPSLGGIR